MKSHSEYLAFLDSLCENWRAFPNTANYKGYYEFLTQTIVLPDIEGSDAESATAGNLSSKLKIYPLLAHELRHWEDHVSTLWGREFLIAAYNAIHARASNLEKNFSMVMDFRYQLNRVFLDDYYTQFDVGAEDPVRPWSAKHTCGILFDERGRLDESRPIVFTRFSDCMKREIVRVPFSAASLLEVNARCDQIGIHIGLVSTISNPDVRLMEQAGVDVYLRKLYDPLQCVYTVAAHNAGNVMNIADPLTAYKLAESISMLCLNMPTSAFKKLIIPTLFRGEAEAFRRAERLRVLKDRGFLFVCLLEHGRGERIDEPTAWIEAVLTKAGLPNLATLEMDAVAEFNSAPGIIAGPEEERLGKLLHVGRRMFRRRGILNYHPLQSLNSLGTHRVEFLPSIFLRNGVFTANGIPHCDEDWIERSKSYDAKIREFARACMP